MNEIKILGYTLKEWVNMMDSTQAENVEKALEYYDGEQEECMEDLLDDPHKGRKNWKERGIIPRWRNITNMIVEKSGKLFKDNPPSVTVYNDGANQVNIQATDLFLQELYKANWLDFFNNLDSSTRLVKTTMTLVQFDPIDRSLAFELLHRANSAVIMDSTMKHIVALIYKTSEQESIETYRIITQDEYIDLIESEDETGERVTISNRILNPYGCVPVAVFHDTKKPRNGFWNKPGMDLITINELYNLHLTDSEYAISWSKLPTLFTNCSFSDSNTQLELAVAYGQKLPQYMQAGSELIGGPSRVIQLDSNGVDSPFIEYKSPAIDIKPLDEVVNNWLEQYGSDWSVKMTNNYSGHSKANSGFQLIVEEIPNRELRQQRAKMFESGFKQVYKVIAQVLNIQNGRTVLPLDADAYIEFNQFTIPVDPATEQSQWDLMIKGNRASVIDYLVEVKGLSIEEAVLKAQEIKDYNQQFGTTNINNNTNTLV
jgi:hypothetical protein